MNINDKMIIKRYLKYKCNNAKEYSWLIKELMEEKEMKENVKYTDVYKKGENKMKKIVEYVDYSRYDVESTKTLFNHQKDVYKKCVKCLVRTDIIPWENCGIIGTIPYKEAINDLEGTILKVGDYVKVVDIRNERSRTVTSIIVDNGNRLVPYCNKDYDSNNGIDKEHNILLIKVGEFPTYSHTVDPEKEVPRFVIMDQDEFNKQTLVYYKAQYENTLSKLEVLQKKYDDLENTNELLKHKIETMRLHMNSHYGKI